MQDEKEFAITQPIFYRLAADNDEKIAQEKAADLLHRTIHVGDEKWVIFETEVRRYPVSQNRFYIVIMAGKIDD